jgi:hypothetical protein
MILAAVLAGVLHGSPGAAAAPLPAAAPAGHPQAHEEGPSARDMEISPRVGPPGTRVTLSATRMPSLTPVQLAIGATRSGFEALALGLTTIDGDLHESVVVPAWAKSDQIHRFLVFNLYFSAVLAESALFHVTGADGSVVREGVVTRAEPGCLALAGDDGERYRLRGRTAELSVGERVRVEGKLSESSEGCGEELSLDLELTRIVSGAA